jgi:hypothetical protein
MRKPLAGKAFFEAMGRRAYTQGLPIVYERAMRNMWPMWARSAWARGWLHQQPPRALTESIVSSFEKEARATGKTLRETVNHFLDKP